MNAHDIAPLLHTLGVEPDKLGCVMLEAAPLPVRSWVGGDEDPDFDPWVFAPEGHPWTWVKGPVGETGAHVTVKYGFLQPAHLPVMADLVGRLMADYEPGMVLRTAGVDVFPEPSVSELGYACLVARIDDEPLRQWNKALSLLPHIDTYPDYKPHLTLGYVRKVLATYCKNRLEAHLPPYIETTGLSLGDRILA